MCQSLRKVNEFLTSVVLGLTCVKPNEKKLSVSRLTVGKQRAFAWQKTSIKVCSEQLP